MSKTVFSIIIICSMLFVTHPVVVPAQTAVNNSVEKIKTDVYRFGTGEKAKVVVSLKNGPKVKGHIVRTGDDSFEIADAKTKRSASIGYGEVSQIKKAGMSTMTKVLIGAGIGAAIAVVVIAVAIKTSFPDTISIARPQ